MTLTEFLGTTPTVFILLIGVLFGGGAWMTGQALAQTWRSPRFILPYTLLLAAAARFLAYGLFQGVLLSLTGLLAAWAVLLAIALVAFRATRAGVMARQYPWLYERTGFFTWREKA